jgi:hypothetical protein
MIIYATTSQILAMKVISRVLLKRNTKRDYLTLQQLNILKKQREDFTQYGVPLKPLFVALQKIFKMNETLKRAISGLFILFY